MKILAEKFLSLAVVDSRQIMRILIFYMTKQKIFDHPFFDRIRLYVEDRCVEKMLRVNMADRSNFSIFITIPSLSSI